MNGKNPITIIHDGNDYGLNIKNVYIFTTFRLLVNNFIYFVV